MAKRYNGTCKACKRTVSVLAERGDNVRLPTGEWAHGYVVTDGRVLIGAVNSGDIVVECPSGCANDLFPAKVRKIRLSPVQGKLNLKVACNAKCMGSTRHVCECSCGGKNHGASHD